MRKKQRDFVSMTCFDFGGLYSDPAGGVFTSLCTSAYPDTAYPDHPIGIFRTTQTGFSTFELNKSRWRTESASTEPWGVTDECGRSGLSMRWKHSLQVSESSYKTQKSTGIQKKMYYILIFFSLIFQTGNNFWVYSAASASLGISTPQSAPLCCVKTASSGHDAGQSKVCKCACQVTANTSATCSANSCFGAAAKRDGVLAASPVKTSCGRQAD